MNESTVGQENMADKETGGGGGGVLLSFFFVGGRLLLFDARTYTL